MWPANSAIAATPQRSCLRPTSQSLRTIAALFVHARQTRVPASRRRPQVGQISSSGSSRWRTSRPSIILFMARATVA